MTKSFCCSEQARSGETALAEFYEQWKDDPLVMLKWIALQVARCLIVAACTLS